MNNVTESKLGDTTPTRDLIYVKDTVDGFLKIAESSKTIGEEINIATQSEISVGDLAQKLINLINPQARIVYEEQRVRPAKSEVFRLFGSNEKIKALTNWKQQYTFDQALKETIDWFSNPKNLKQYKHDVYNV